MHASPLSLALLLLHWLGLTIRKLAQSGAEVAGTGSPQKQGQAKKSPRDVHPVLAPVTKKRHEKRPKVQVQSCDTWR